MFITVLFSTTYYLLCPTYLIFPSNLIFLQDAKSVPGLNININNHNYAHKDQPISPMNFGNSLPLISLSSKFYSVLPALRVISMCHFGGWVNSDANVCNLLPLFVLFILDSGSAHNSPINSAATSSNRTGQLGNHKDLPGIWICFFLWYSVKWYKVTSVVFFGNF